MLQSSRIIEIENKAKSSLNKFYNKNVCTHEEIETEINFSEETHSHFNPTWAQPNWHTTHELASLVLC